MAELHKRFLLAGFGEVMVELRRAIPSASSSTEFSQSVGGDVFNALASASACGLQTQFVSALGQDFHFERHFELLRQFGVGLDHCKVVDGKNAVYFVNLKPDGQREFQFYRSDSAMAKLDSTFFASTHDQILKSDAFFSSAVAFAIGAGSASTAMDLVSAFHAQRKPVALDLNFRPQLWTLKAAARSFKDLAKKVSILFLSEDELPLASEILGVSTLPPDEVAKGLSELGPKLVVIRLGAKGAVAFDGALGKTLRSSVIPKIEAVDTTGAGDAFAGAFLASTFLERSSNSEKDLQHALDRANQWASRKVQSTGTLTFLLGN